jgi:hypothetical protein
MTFAVQWEPDGLRAARMKRCEDILAGKLASLQYVGELDLHNLQLEDARMCAALARIASVPTVRTLNIGFNALRGEAMAALARSSFALRLEKLELTGNVLGDLGISALFAGDFPELRELGLSWCELGDGAAGPLANARGMPKLRELSLRRNHFTDRGAAILAASKTLTGQLTRIDLDSNDEVTRAGSKALLAAFGDALVR